MIKNYDPTKEYNGREGIRFPLETMIVRDGVARIYIMGSVVEADWVNSVPSGSCIISTCEYTVSFSSEEVINILPVDENRKEYYKTFFRNYITKCIFVHDEDSIVEMFRLPHFKSLRTIASSHDLSDYLETYEDHIKEYNTLMSQGKKRQSDLPSKNPNKNPGGFNASKNDHTNTVVFVKETPIIYFNLSGEKYVRIFPGGTRWEGDVRDSKPIGDGILSSPGRYNIVMSFNDEKRSFNKPWQIVIIPPSTSTDSMITICQEILHLKKIHLYDYSKFRCNRCRDSNSKQFFNGLDIILCCESCHMKKKEEGRKIECSECFIYKDCEKFYSHQTNENEEKYYGSICKKCLKL